LYPLPPFPPCLFQLAYRVSGESSELRYFTFATLLLKTKAIPSRANTIIAPLRLPSFLRECIYNAIMLFVSSPPRVSDFQASVRSGTLRVIGAKITKASSNGEVKVRRDNLAERTKVLGHRVVFSIGAPLAVPFILFRLSLVVRPFFPLSRSDPSSARFPSAITGRAHTWRNSMYIDTGWSPSRGITLRHRIYTGGCVHVAR